MSGLLALLAAGVGVAEGATPTPTGPPPTGTDPATLTDLRAVATGGYSWRSAGAEASRITYVSGEHQVRVPARNLRVSWGTGAVGGAATPVTLRASVEVGGICYPVTWAGQTWLDLTTHPSSAISDPVPVQVEAGQTIRVRHEIPAGGRSPYYLLGGLHSSGAAGGGWTAGGDLPLGSLQPHAPLAILGDTDPALSRAAVILGDSFVEAGWARGAIDSAGYAWSDTGVWLEIIPRDRTQLANRLPATGTWAYDMALALHSGNDSWRPTAEQQALHIAAWRMYRDAGIPRVYGVTIHPYASSTDGYTSTLTQTIWADRYVDDFNLWMRDGAPLDPETFAPVAAGGTGARMGEPGHPLAGFFDIHAATSTAATGGVWKVGDGTGTTGTAWTTDGAHLTAHGSAMLQQAFTSWLDAHL